MIKLDALQEDIYIDIYSLMPGDDIIKNSR